MNNNWQVKFISENLEIAVSLAKKIYLKMEPFINWSEISKEELLEEAKEWKEHYENR